MNFYQQVKTLIHKDIKLEWRSKFAINSILLYVVSTVFVCYQSFHSLQPEVWNALFWIILLFASVNAMSRSFHSESSGKQLYYYSIASPQAIILAKMVYNSLLMILLTFTAFVVYNLMFPNPLHDLALFGVAILLGSISFASVFTMVAGISAKAGSNSTLMAILSFPVIIPLLMVLVKLSFGAITETDFGVNMKDISLLLFINVITITISLLLFPYLWRD